MIEALSSSGVLAALGLPGGAEWILILAFGLLIFGKRLPEVGRSLGKGIVEFKKGLKGIEEEVEQVDTDLTTTASRPRPVLTHEEKKPAFKFDPYTGKPVEEPVARFDPYTGKPLDQEGKPVEQESDEHTTATH